MRNLLGLAVTPAPPRLEGVLLVVSMTLGVIVGNWAIA